MDENREILEQLKKTNESIRRQTRILLVMGIFMIAAAVFCGIAMGVMFRFAGQLEEALPRVNDIVTQLEAVLGNLETTSGQLAAMDLEQMVTDVNTLVTTCQSSLEQTMVKLDAIDFEMLNDAIEDLSAVIKPLADFFSSFGSFGR